MLYHIISKALHPCEITEGYRHLIMYIDSVILKTNILHTTFNMILCMTMKLISVRKGESKLRHKLYKKWNSKSPNSVGHKSITNMFRAENE